MVRERFVQFRERLHLSLESVDEYPRPVMERPETWGGFFVVVLAALISIGITVYGALPLAAIYVDAALRGGGAASIVLLITGVVVVAIAFILVHHRVELWLIRGSRLPNQVLRSLASLAETVVALTVMGMLIDVVNRLGMFPRSPVTDIFVASTRPSATKLAAAAAILLVSAFATGVRTGTDVGPQIIRRAGAAHGDPQNPTQT
jgi:hypothetical protein